MGADVLSTELLYRAKNKDEEPLFSQPEENAAIYYYYFLKYLPLIIVKLIQSGY